MAYAAKKFPPLCASVVARLPEERVVKLFASWMGVAEHYGGKYANEVSELARLCQKLKDNTAAAEARAPNPNATNVLMLTDGNISEIEEGLQAGNTFSMVFDGDDYSTDFRKVDGELMAFEPRFPDGRKVRSASDQTYDMTEDNMMRFRCVMSLCLTGGETRINPMILTRMSRLEEVADAVSVMALDANVRRKMVCLAFIIAAKHADIVKIMPEHDGLAVAVARGHEADEVARDIVEMVRVLV